MQPEAERRTSVEDLAAEFLSQRAADSRTDEREFLGRLGSEAERDEFQSLVAGAVRAERSLPRALISGTVLCGRYRIVEEIGSGGMGRVFAAFDARLERKVAVKVLSALTAGDAEREEMFMKESRLLAALQHPGIVAVHEAGRDDDLTYIVMDLVDGVSLDRVIERAANDSASRASDGSLRPRDGLALERAIDKRLPHGRTSLIVPGDWYRSVARVLLEIARTIESAHGAQVIHRDLKPANVMLLGGGNPVVLDFGLAGSQETKAGAVTRGLYGSVAYLAPEQAKSEQVGTDPRTDVYQLGLILYELLTLRRAFPGQAIGEVMDRIRHGDFRSPRSVNRAVPRDLEAICMMALELEPERRYATAREFREDLERYADGAEIPIALRGNRLRAIARSTRYQLRRHPWRVAAAGMIGVALVASLIARSVRGASDDPYITAWAWNEARDSAAYRLVGDADPVEFGDWLGIHVRATQPTFLYALSVFEGPDHVRRVAPKKLVPEDHPEQSEDPDAPYGCPVGVGEQNLFASRISPPDDEEEANQLEGLHVWASAKERPELERLLRDLESSLALRPKGVPFEDVKSSLVAVLDGAGRGAQSASFSPSERAAILKNAREKTAAADKEALVLKGTTTFTVECRVEPAK